MRNQLSERILWAAKDVFLEMGFERASMDAIADRAESSKRTLYAHFESKENLFLAVFCTRYVQSIIHTDGIRMCRVSASEAERFRSMQSNISM